MYWKNRVHCSLSLLYDGVHQEYIIVKFIKLIIWLILALDVLLQWEYWHSLTVRGNLRAFDYINYCRNLKYWCGYQRYYFVVFYAKDAVKAIIIPLWCHAMALRWNVAA